MKKVLYSIVGLILLFGALPSTAIAAACDTVHGFSYTAIETNKYRFTGIFPNCPNSQGHILLSAILNGGTGSVGDGIPNIPIRTTADGSFSQDVSLPYTGAYEVFLTNDGSSVANSTITFRIEGSKVYECGQEIPQNDSRLCKDGCIPSHLTGVWKCEKPGSPTFTPTPRTAVPAGSGTTVNSDEKIDRYTFNAPTYLPKYADRYKVINNALSLLLSIISILSIGFLIWGGIELITSEGDKQKVQGARGRITYAILGLILAFLSFFIVQLIGYVFGLQESGRAILNITL